MESIVTIDDKKYVILPLENYEALAKKQVYQKYKGELLDVKEARERTKARMEKWAKLK
jgi:hypothetical protein